MNEQYVTISRAARDIGMDRNALRLLVKAAGVAIRWGGSDEHPYLRVKLSDARRAVEMRKYVEPVREVKPQPRRKLAGAANNPDVRC